MIELNGIQISDNNINTKKNVKIYINEKQLGNINDKEVDALKNEVNTLKNAGYLYAGVATSSTNPGTPKAKVFYIANGKGTYTNFGGINVTENDVVILYYDTAWHKVATGIASNDKLTDTEVNNIWDNN